MLLYVLAEQKMSENGLKLEDFCLVSYTILNSRGFSSAIDQSRTSKDFDSGLKVQYSTF